ncbi:hypothetical protein LZC95_48400 [Pendulispora brunnea]|uniref:CYTH domain-containing protein n=1 Tax=Pendulispora brunnea TaxID=2905690 RepID=A0ABZ2K6E1_9BACT
MESKYARLEYERRWLVTQLPDLGPNVEGSHIDDRYLCGTTLRLRRVTPIGNGPPVYKLGQKVRPDPDDSRQVLHTTMYLTADEYTCLSRLAGFNLQKMRYRLAREGRTFSLDVFQGKLSGLALLEIETEPGDTSFTAPPFVDREVTGEERYTGGWLARASNESIE